MQLKTVIVPEDLRKKTGQVLLPFSKAGYKYTPENAGKIFNRLGDPPLPYFYVISTPLCGVGGKDQFKLKIGVSNAKSKMSRLATYARHYSDTQERGGLKFITYVCSSGGQITTKAPDFMSYTNPRLRESVRPQVCGRCLGQVQRDRTKLIKSGFTRETWRS